MNEDEIEKVPIKTIIHFHPDPFYNERRVPMADSQNAISTERSTATQSSSRKRGRASPTLWGLRMGPFPTTTTTPDSKTASNQATALSRPSPRTSSKKNDDDDALCRILVKLSEVVDDPLQTLENANAAYESLSPDNEISGQD